MSYFTCWDENMKFFDWKTTFVDSISEQEFFISSNVYNFNWKNLLITHTC